MPNLGLFENNIRPPYRKIRSSLSASPAYQKREGARDAAYGLPFLSVKVRTSDHLQMS